MNESYIGTSHWYARASPDDLPHITYSSLSRLPSALPPRGLPP